MPKRLGKGLYERIISMDNLLAADLEAQKGKTGRGVVIAHNAKREEELLRLHEALRDKTYTPSPYRKFRVYEPKEREISCQPFYPECILYHAINRTLGKAWTRTFPYNSYACIKGRGITACARHVRRTLDSYRREGKKCYALKMDIRHFYPSVDGEVMKSVIRRKVKCKDTLWLLDRIIDSAEGLPIGNYISQFLANLLMSYFMHEMSDVFKADCVEYSDDIIVFSDNKAFLHGLFHDFIEPYIAETLKLTIKGNWQVFPIAKNKGDRKGRALDYVGYLFYMEHTGLRKSTKMRFARRVSAMRKKGISGVRLAKKSSSWTGWCKHADCNNLVKTVMLQEARFVRYINNSNIKTAA